MEIIAHGIDLVECSRIERIMRRHGDAFLHRVLTPLEQAEVTVRRDYIPFISGRFAAKEAILKMLGTGWQGQISWQDMEINHDVSGRPVAELDGECARVAQRLRIAKILLSITHTRTYASASAIGVGEPEA